LTKNKAKYCENIALFFGINSYERGEYPLGNSMGVIEQTRGLNKPKKGKGGIK